MSEAFGLVLGWLPFLAVVAVLAVKGPKILHYWEWGPDYVQGLCLCSIVIESVVVQCVSLPLDYCQ